MSTKTPLGLSGTLLVWFNMMFGGFAAMLSVWAAVATEGDPEAPHMLYLAGFVTGLAFAAMGHLRWRNRAGKPSAEESEA
ncbi:hypothetical protein [Pseudomonas viridiflava]|uniref:hypothetical protein n=1 Tax=Pseudomonas viridiflava TaxID=33069 RepID=UPI000F02E780|nr:hypothetical protein [Pseudomonas viridiflava]